MDVTVLRPGANCWRIERADRAALIVDAADYFAARAAMLKAKRRIMLIGWDFDARIRLGDAETDGRRRRSGLHPLAGRAPPGARGLRAALGPRRGEVALPRHDAAHPAALDAAPAHPRQARRRSSAGRLAPPEDRGDRRCVAFCGGIDMTSDRWDTREHRDDDPRRTAAERQALRALARRDHGDRRRGRGGAWRACARALARAGGGELAPVRGARRLLAGRSPTAVRDVDVAIARTQPDHDGTRRSPGDRGSLPRPDRRAPSASSISRASISPRAASPRRSPAALARARRAGDRAGQPRAAPTAGWSRRRWTAPARACRGAAPADRHGRFRSISRDRGRRADLRPCQDHDRRRPAAAGRLVQSQQPLDGLDTECDLAIEAASPANGGTGARIRASATGLLAEHLGVAPDEVERPL